MKLRKLFLSAFGPFTGRVLDFAATPAQLHLIYGPNEAGKSSALRAMGDLRFGIPLRSADNFRHDNAQLLLAGVFEAADGEAVALARRKKNKDPLTAADPDTGEPFAQRPVSAAVQQALTGGLDRARFELSFGLDHARLREGGRQLVQGEGELGAALFEASAGLQGVKALLATLQEDAKAYYGPRSAQAVINEAARQLEEHKQALKKALVRPEAWRDRQRALEAAAAQLKTLQDEMAALRHRAATLAELRAVQPLLQQFDRAQADASAHGPAPALAPDARERRLAAELSVQAAEPLIAQAGAELADCAQTRSRLTLAPRLLVHAGAIEHLLQDFEAVRRQRGELLQARLAVQARDAEMAAQAAHIAPGQGAGAVLAAAPTPAERLALDALLDTGARVAQSLADAEARIRRTEAQREAAAPAAGADPEPPPAVPAAVEAALQQALALGDTEARQPEVRRELEDLAQRLRQVLDELGLHDIAPLQAARPLLAAQITQAEQTRATLEAERAALQSEDMQLQRDLQGQLHRQQQLAAVGEVVTAQTLERARSRRDTLWRSLKDRFASAPDSARPPDTPAQSSLLPADPPARLTGTALSAFEQAQAEADRQADLLREGAERAAQAAECALRIGENHVAREALSRSLAAWRQQDTQAEATWLASLQAAGLPTHPPPALRDWLMRRGAALELWQRHASLAREAADAGVALQSARSLLQQALAPIAAWPLDALPLAALVPQARSWLQRQLEREANARALAAQRRQWQAEHDAAQGDADRLRAQRSDNAAAQAGWMARLRLPDGSSAQAVKGRFAEIAELAQAGAAQQQQRALILKLEAMEDALMADAAALAALLGETLGTDGSDGTDRTAGTEGSGISEAPGRVHLGDFIDRLQRRSTQAAAAAAQAAELTRRESAAQRQLEKATAQRDVAEAALAELCAAAGVALAGALPVAEAQAERSRALQADVQRLAAQLAAASVRPLAGLRAEVADLDTAGTDAERDRLAASVPALQARIDLAGEAVLTARQAFEAIDTSGAAAGAREQMESAAARYRSALQPWAQLKMAESLLQEALRRFRERAQGPMVTLASEYFGLITGGRYPRLRVDEAGDRPALQAVDADGRAIGVEAMSEGTADQLYLALRLAALELQRNPVRDMPLVLDDVLMTSDDARAAQMFRALARFSEGGQVLLFTHHQHLVPLAQSVLAAPGLAVHAL